MMEPLPRGANFQRTKFLWEIGLHIAGDPNTPYYGNRDMCIVVGSGSGEKFRPWLRMATGAPHLAYAVCRGELEMAMVNPSGFLTQAYRGTGLFKEPLPVRVIANYPSWDRFVYMLHPRTGLKSLAEIIDEGLVLWFDEALAAGMEPIPLEESVLKKLEAIGWRRVVIPAGRYPHLKSDHMCLDYSAWPLYTRASLPDEDAYKVCDALQARKDEIFWESSYTGIGQLGQETEATPMDVPLHPGAAKWYREHGFKV